VCKAIERFLSQIAITRVNVVVGFDQFLEFQESECIAGTRRNYSMGSEIPAKVVIELVVERFIRAFLGQC
jgi:hypothetical protein